MRSVAGLILVALMAAVGVVALDTGTAGAAPAVTLLPITGTPSAATSALAWGADGNMWFTMSTADAIGRMTPAGAVTTFTAGITAGGRPTDIVLGPDGNMWFVELFGDRIGRITPEGVVTEFSEGISRYAEPNAITVGPDGNLWFTQRARNAIGRITPTGTVTQFPDSHDSWNDLQDITSGPDGNLWFTRTAVGHGIGRMTTSGVYTHFNAGITAGATPKDITTGPDGNVWFTEANRGIGRSTPDGVITEFVAGLTFNGNPTGITPGPDGKLWFSEQNRNKLATITTDGVITELPIVLPFQTLPAQLTAGPNGSLWFNSGLAAKLGRIDGIAGAGSWFQPLTPRRLFDSRTSTRWAGQLGAGAPRTLAVAGVAPVPTSAVSVILNVTVTQSSENSFLTVHPAGTPKPTASNLNFARGETTANLVTVRLGAGGQVAFANAIGAVDVVVDVVGYFVAGAGDGFTATAPQRALDSRTTTGAWSSPLAAGSPRTLGFDAVSVPASADAVLMNVTVTASTAASFVTVQPAGSTAAVSNLNFDKGQTIANLVVVQLGANERVSFTTAAGAVHVIADVVGYFEAGTGDRFNALDPTRLLDSRTDVGGWSTKLDATAPRELVVRPSSVPDGASAIVGNVTVTGGTHNSFLTVYPDGSVPNASTLNFAAGTTRPNLVAVRIASGGHITFANAVGATDVVFDAAGYFAPS